MNNAEFFGQRIRLVFDSSQSIEARKQALVEMDERARLVRDGEKVLDRLAISSLLESFCMSASPEEQEQLSALWRAFSSNSIRVRDVEDVPTVSRRQRKKSKTTKPADIEEAPIIADNAVHNEKSPLTRGL